MSSRTLIIGCGYVGLPLALRLMEQKHEVTGWVHSPESAAALPWSSDYRRMLEFRRRWLHL